jgi:hypothetical protein
VWGAFWHVPPERQPARDAHLLHRSPTDYGDADWLYGRGAAVAPSS